MSFLKTVIQMGSFGQIRKFIPLLSANSQHFRIYVSLSKMHRDFIIILIFLIHFHITKHSVFIKLFQ